MLGLPSLELARAADLGRGGGSGTPRGSGRAATSKRFDRSSASSARGGAGASRAPRRRAGRTSGRAPRCGVRNCSVVGRRGRRGARAAGSPRRSGRRRRTRARSSGVSFRAQRERGKVEAGGPALGCAASRRTRRRSRLDARAAAGGRRLPVAQPQLVGAHLGEPALGAQPRERQRRGDSSRRGRLDPGEGAGARASASGCACRAASDAVEDDHDRAGGRRAPRRGAGHAVSPERGAGPRERVEDRRGSIGCDPVQRHGDVADEDETGSLSRSSRLIHANGRASVSAHSEQGRLAVARGRHDGDDGGRRVHLDPLDDRGAGDGPVAKRGRMELRLQQRKGAAWRRRLVARRGAAIDSARGARRRPRAGFDARPVRSCGRAPGVRWSP